MMKLRILRRFSLLAGMTVSLHAWAGGVSDDLTSAQRDIVKSGKQVMMTQEVEGKPWPRVKIYQVVAATPEEVAAVFVDYNNAKLYTPNLLKSEIVKTTSPTVKEIDYGVDIPILPDEYYTARNTLSCPEKGVYRIDWKLLRAVQTKASEGCIRIEPFEDRALICYQNLVTPGSIMAGLLRGKALEQMRETVAALAQRVEKQKTANSADLDREVKELRAALAE
jgi:hypothetical protein